MGDKTLMIGRNFFQSQYSPLQPPQVVSLHPAEEVRNERDKHRFHDLSEVTHTLPCSCDVNAGRPHHVASAGCER